MGHRYWKLGELIAGPSAGGYVAGGECYLRATPGGSNLAPSAGASSTPYSSGVSVLYDGNAATWWASNAGPSFVAFDYGTGVDVQEIMWQNRPDYTPQGPLGGNIYWSDTSITGPWTFQSDFTFPTWTSNGQIQTATALLPLGMRVPEHHGLTVVAPTGLFVPEHHGLAVMPNSGEFVSEQHALVVMPNRGAFVATHYAYAAIVPGGFSRRRQVLLGSI